MSSINSSDISTNSENFKGSNTEDDDITYLFTVDSSSDEQVVMEIDLQTQALSLRPYKSSVKIVDLTHKSEADDTATNDSIVSIEEPETTDDETVEINDSVVIIEEPETADCESYGEQTDEVTANDSITIVEEHGPANATDEEKCASAKQPIITTIEQPESRTPSKPKKRKYHQKENKKKKRYSNQLRCAACSLLYDDVRGNFYMSISCNHVFCGQCLYKDDNTESCPTCGIKFLSFRRVYL